VTDRDIRNNLVGIIVGALPQPPMMIPQLFDILLRSSAGARRRPASRERRR
jgi:hypothetical protein